MSTTPTDLLRLIAGYSTSPKYKIHVYRIHILPRYFDNRVVLYLYTDVYLLELNLNFGRWFGFDHNGYELKKMSIDDLKKFLTTRVYAFKIEKQYTKISQDAIIEFSNEINWEEVKLDIIKITSAVSRGIQ